MACSGGLSAEVIVGILAIGSTLGGAFLTFVIGALVKMGKLETRVDTVERDQDNLGDSIRTIKNPNYRRSA